MRDVDKAVDYLVATDESAAKAKALVAFLEDKKKTVKATIMADLDGSISSREVVAHASETYKQACEDYRDAVYEFELLKNRRKSAELVVEVWRTESANQRTGNV